MGQRPGTKQRLAEMEAMPKEKLGVARRAYIMLIVTLGPRYKPSGTNCVTLDHFPNLSISVSFPLNQGE